MSPQPISLYVHIPFCRTRCTYCAFNTYAGLDSWVDPYLDALAGEMRWVGRRADSTVSHTLYLGGGTPSLLAPEQVAAIIETCRIELRLADDAEISLEANPRTVDAESLAGYRAAGVTRLSLGVQSAQSHTLKLFGRNHTFTDAADAFRLARQVGFDDINVDLIYGAPSQSRDEWRETLEAVLDWSPDHVALYSLTLEPNTALQHRVERGLVAHPDPDLAADMYDDACARLAKAGLGQYELSNWARPGYECRHNRQYWLNRPYLGFGAGAHGAANGLRYWNVNPVAVYVGRVRSARVQGGLRFPLSPAVCDYEEIDRSLAMAETAILGLRLVREGLDTEDFARRFGLAPDVTFGPLIDDLKDAGLLAAADRSLRLTRRAYLVSNRVFAQFLP